MSTYLPFFILAISILCSLKSRKLLIEVKKWSLIIITIVLITSPIIIRNYNTIGSILPIETPDISSTEIREWVSEGREFRHMVPKTVAEFITDNKLYLSGAL